jgi:hypothetical protein
LALLPFQYEWIRHHAFLLQKFWRQDKDCGPDKLRYRQTANNSRKWNPSCEQPGIFMHMPLYGGSFMSVIVCP